MVPAPSLFLSIRPRVPLLQSLTKASAALCGPVCEHTLRPRNHPKRDLACRLPLSSKSDGGTYPARVRSFSAEQEGENRATFAVPRCVDPRNYDHPPPGPPAAQLVLVAGLLGPAANAALGHASCGVLSPVRPTCAPHHPKISWLGAAVPSRVRTAAPRTRVAGSSGWSVRRHAYEPLCRRSHTLPTRCPSASVSGAAPLSMGLSEREIALQLSGVGGQPRP